MPNIIKRRSVLTNNPSDPSTAPVPSDLLIVNKRQIPRRRPTELLESPGEDLTLLRRIGIEFPHARGAVAKKGNVFLDHPFVVIKQDLFVEFNMARAASRYVAKKGSVFMADPLIQAIPPPPNPQLAVFNAGYKAARLARFDQGKAFAESPVLQAVGPGDFPVSSVFRAGYDAGRFARFDRGKASSASPLLRLILPPLDLLEATISYLQGQTSLNALFGPPPWIWDVAPMGQQFPFVRLVDVNESPYYYASSGTETGNEIDRNHFQISVFTLGSKLQAIQLANAIRSVLNDAPLNFQTGTLLMIRCSSRAVATLDPDPGPGGQNVWHSTLMFVADVHRQLPT